jgi:hypothetical protein
MALDLSQLCILSARQSYIRQYGKMASIPITILQQVKPTDKVQRFDFCCNFLERLDDDDKIMNKLVFNDEAMFRLSDLTQMDVFLRGFVKDNVYVPPLPTTLHELKTRVREACVNTDQEILHNVWQEVEYRFDVAQPLMALTLNFINDKLLFIKDFNWSFSWYVFCECNLK